VGTTARGGVPQKKLHDWIFQLFTGFAQGGAKMPTQRAPVALIRAKKNAGVASPSYTHEKLNEREAREGVFRRKNFMIRFRNP
jgi:hypothetical protein